MNVSRTHANVGLGLPMDRAIRRDEGEVVAGLGAVREGRGRRVDASHRAMEVLDDHATHRRWCRLEGVHHRADGGAGQLSVKNADFQ